MSKRPLVIGLTGSIGMGKSTTAQMFRDEGVPVWDADEAVERLYAEGGKGAKALAAVFPDAVENGRVNKDVLRKIVSGKETAFRRLEEIVHPLVAEDRAAFLRHHASIGTPIVVLDIPLLLETGAGGLVDHVVVVSTDEATQRARVMARGKMSAKELDAILGRQVPDAEKRRKADTVIRTDTMESARAAVRELLEKLGREAGNAGNRSGH